MIYAGFLILAATACVLLLVGVAVGAAGLPGYLMSLWWKS